MVANRQGLYVLPVLAHLQVLARIATVPLEIYAVMEQVLVHCVLKDRTVYAHLCQLMLCATLEMFAHQMDHYAQQAAALWLAQAMAATLMTCAALGRQEVIRAQKVKANGARTCQLALLAPSQFVNTLETNILTSIGSLVNVTITNVVLGSISVSNTIAFTDADSLAAAAGQTALAQALSSGDVSLFGTTFGSVTVSNVKQANATNPDTTTTTSGASSAGIAMGTLALAVMVAIAAVNA
ncbi:TPA: hypothetical protein ACH3X3_001488 [Trebouxia sp. C0006]